MKKTLTLIVTAAVFAWIVSAAGASYSTLDRLHPAKKVTKVVKVTKVAKTQSAGSRLIYIYSTGPVGTPVQPTPAEQCALDNVDLVAHALDPVDCG
jgi:hypothetical protein